MGKAAGAVIEEVRRQSLVKLGIMEGTAKPDYASSVDIVTKPLYVSLSVCIVVAASIVGFVFSP
ncbi:MAG: sodium/proton-translocating pyrophosphatase [Deinococcales bacterium]